MRRHDLDPVSLVIGLLFAGVALLSLLQAGPGVPAKWGAPVLLIGAGVVGLVAAGRGRSKPPSS